MLCAVALAPGCPNPCSGAECASQFDASKLAVHLGDTGLLDGDQDPLDGALNASGTAQHGIGWRALPAPGVVLVGVPDLYRVQALSAALAANSTQLDALTVGTLSGEQEADRFGAAIARVPDFDGSGVDELLVGAPGLLGGDNALEAGAAYLFLDLADGWTGELSAEDAALVIKAEEAYDQLGQRLEGCADLDGDGLGDLLIANAWGDGTDDNAIFRPLAGEVYPVLSSEHDLSTREELLVGELAADRIWQGRQTGAQLGRALDCASDLSNSGAATVVLGAPFANETGVQAGAVYVMSAPSSWAGGPVFRDSRRVLDGEDADEHFGAAVATGDVNGDGAPELVIGSPGADGGRGAITYYDGRSIRQGNFRNSYRVSGVEASGHFGANLAIADLDGDGLGELLVGAPRANPFDSDGTFAAGVLYLFSGATLPESGIQYSASELVSARFVYRQQFLQVGESFEVGDYDGEGGLDLALTVRVDSSTLATTE